MSRALLFSDGFDAYLTLTQMWDGGVSGSDSVDNAGVLSRSGLGCLVINTGGGGPGKLFTAGGKVIVSGALNSSDLGSNGTLGPVFQLFDTNPNVSQIGLLTTDDGGVAVAQNTLAPAVLARSAANLVRANVYNVFTLMVTIGNPGSVKVWANGVKVLDVTGINTDPAATGLVNKMTLRCLGGGTLGLWDDISLWSYTDHAADEFPFMASCLPFLPVSDAAPSQWLPKTAGSPHFAMVDAVPASTTNYVFDATPGDIDQYLHQIPANQIKPPLGNQAQVLGVSHKMLAGLDAAGARTIASTKSGVASGSFPLSTTPAFYLQPYTPGANSVGDLNLTPFGPEVTA